MVKQLLTSVFCVAQYHWTAPPLQQSNTTSQTIMKRIQLTMAALLVAAGLVGTGGAYAQTNDPTKVISVRKSDSKKIRLYTQSPVELAVVDADGTILYKGDVNGKTGQVTALNLRNLPDGRYFLTATNNDFWVSQGLTIRNDQVSVDASNAATLVKPTLTAYGKNKFEVTMPGARNINVTIYDRFNALVFNELYQNGEKHRFDLSRLPEGDYTILVGPEFKQFSERIMVQR